jgi:hypothetical protein
MAKEKSWLDKDWNKRTTGGKIAYGAVGGTALNELMEMWKGDTDRLSDIDKMIAESEKSPYNVAQVSKENIDYYNKALADYTRARREAEYGLSPEETAAARQGFAETTNLARQNALTAGGGTLGKYINATLNAGQGQFATQLAAQDADIKRQKQQQLLAYLGQVGQAAGTYQDVAIQNFQKQMLAEQALGQAKTDWYAQRDANRRALIQAGAQTVQAGAQTVGAVASDIRLKENIVFSHEENGHKIYEFNYKSDPKTRYSGVMAQEVININPSAVIEENGYYKVNYDMLGVTMKKLN